MSNQVITGINIWWVAVMTCVPALITGTVSIIISRFQLKMKISEIKGESEYKARENLFKVYQDVLKVFRENNQRNNEVFGKMLGYITEQDEQEAIKFMKSKLKLIIFLNEQTADSINEIEAELKKYKLLTRKIQEEILFVRKTISIDPEKFLTEDIQTGVMDYLKVSNLLFSFEHILLENKSNELFSKYLT